MQPGWEVRLFAIKRKLSHTFIHPVHEFSHVLQPAHNQRWMMSRGRERPSDWLYPSLSLCVENPQVSTTKTATWEHVPGVWLAPWTLALSVGWLFKAWAHCSRAMALCVNMSWLHCHTQPHTDTQAHIIHLAHCVITNSFVGTLKLTYWVYLYYSSLHFKEEEAILCPQGLSR